MQWCAPLPAGMNPADFILDLANGDTTVRQCRLNDAAVSEVPRTNRLKLKQVKVLSSVAFKFNLRRYTMACDPWSDTEVAPEAGRRCFTPTSPRVHPGLIPG
jgi:hypothetical protein